MDINDINRILEETAFARTGGSENEKRCALYLKNELEKIGLWASLEPFEVPMYDVHTEILEADGKNIPCRAYRGAPDTDVCGEFYYLRGKDELSLEKCRGKIVLTDKPVGAVSYKRLADCGALGFISYNGNMNFPGKDIDSKEIRFKADAYPISGVNIHVSDAVDIVKNGVKTARIVTKQTEKKGLSHNVIADIKGQTDKTVIVCAHYDSTEFSVGAYDNMSSCIALLQIAEHFAKNSHLFKRNLRLVFCGSEERGLLGSLYHCKNHGSLLENTVLNVNLDMLGSVMGEFVAFSCADEKTKETLEILLRKEKTEGDVRLTIRSSDSNSFVHFGVPAVSFARYAPSDTALIHTRYDTKDTLSPETLLKDTEAIIKYLNFVLDAEDFRPQICDEIKAEVEKYMKNKKY